MVELAFPSVALHQDVPACIESLGDLIFVVRHVSKSLPMTDELLAASAAEADDFSDEKDCDAASCASFDSRWNVVQLGREKLRRATDSFQREVQKWKDKLRQQRTCAQHLLRQDLALARLCINVCGGRRGQPVLGRPRCIAACQIRRLCLETLAGCGLSGIGLKTTLKDQLSAGDNHSATAA